MRPSRASAAGTSRSWSPTAPATSSWSPNAQHVGRQLLRVARPRLPLQQHLRMARTRRGAVGQLTPRARSSSANASHDRLPRGRRPPRAAAGRRRRRQRLDRPVCGRCRLGGRRRRAAGAERPSRRPGSGSRRPGGPDVRTASREPRPGGWPAAATSSPGSAARASSARLRLGHRHRSGDGPPFRRRRSPVDRMPPSPSRDAQAGHRMPRDEAPRGHDRGAGGWRLRARGGGGFAGRRRWGRCGRPATRAEAWRRCVGQGRAAPRLRAQGPRSSPSASRTRSCRAVRAAERVLPLHRAHHLGRRLRGQGRATGCSASPAATGSPPRRRRSGATGSRYTLVLTTSAPRTASRPPTAASSASRASTLRHRAGFLEGEPRRLRSSADDRRLRGGVRPRGG